MYADWKMKVARKYLDRGMFLAFIDVGVERGWVSKLRCDVHLGRKCWDEPLPSCRVTFRVL